MSINRVILAAGLCLLAAPAAAQQCRTPAGVRVASAPGCPAKAETPQPTPDRRQPQGTQPGFLDLGNGVQLRIGGRVRVDAVAGR